MAAAGPLPRCADLGRRRRPGADLLRRTGAGLGAADPASWGPDLQTRGLPRPFVLVVDVHCCGAVREVRPQWRAATAC